MNETDYHSKEFFDACEQRADYLKTATTLVELIEHPEYPAYRGITDYIIILLQDLGVERDIIKDVEETFEKNYERYD